MLSTIGVLLVLLATGAFLLAASEAGFFLGRRQKADFDPEGRSQVSIVEGALLGLLGLLLGFTFSMAAGRYDARQEMVIREANALGTVALRCDFLQPSVQGDARAKLQQYADLRLDFAQARLNDDELAAMFGKQQRLQAELWDLAREEARKRPTPIAASLVSALNDLFDLGETRLAALHNKVPTGIWVVLYFVAALAVGSLGYGAGLTGRRVILPVTLVPILMALILTMLADLGHPRNGLIRVSQESMIRVRDGLK